MLEIVVNIELVVLTGRDCLKLSFVIDVCSDFWILCFENKFFDMCSGIYSSKEEFACFRRIAAALVDC